MNTLPTKPQAAPPTEADPVTRWWTPSLQSLQGEMMGDFLTAEIPRALTTTEQSSISSRLETLDAMLAGGDDERVAAILTRLFAAYPAAKMDGTAVASRARTYVAVLADRPAWAVERAAMRWLRGDVAADGKTLDFPPSAARLRHLAAEEMAPAFREKTALQKLQRARVVPVITTERRQAMIAASIAAGIISGATP